MLTIEKAISRMRETLGDGDKAEHSIRVGRIMREMAARFRDADPGFWEIVGILHDVDLPQTETDLTQHGLLAVEMLADILPPEGLQAIAAHDHRTGVAAQGPLDDSLRAADALDPLIRRHSLAQWEEVAAGAADNEHAFLALRRIDPASRSHQIDGVELYSRAYGLTFQDIAQLVRTLQGPALS